VNRPSAYGAWLCRVRASKEGRVPVARKALAQANAEIGQQGLSVFEQTQTGLPI
jgi:hypothetical protein